MDFSACLQSLTHGDAVSLQEVIVEMTNDDGVGGVDYSFECIGNVQVLYATLLNCWEDGAAIKASQATEQGVLTKKSFADKDKFC
jgi:Zn-dependent alcohol dehydrogenase